MRNLKKFEGVGLEDCVLSDEDLNVLLEYEEESGRLGDFHRIFPRFDNW